VDLLTLRLSDSICLGHESRGPLTKDLYLLHMLISNICSIIKGWTRAVTLPRCKLQAPVEMVEMDASLPTWGKGCCSRTSVCTKCFWLTTLDCLSGCGHQQSYSSHVVGNGHVQGEDLRSVWLLRCMGPTWQVADQICTKLDQARTTRQLDDMAWQQAQRGVIKWWNVCNCPKSATRSDNRDIGSLMKMTASH
jgi:hypothetical protein